MATMTHTVSNHAGSPLAKAPVAYDSAKDSDATAKAKWDETTRYLDAMSNRTRKAAAAERVVKVQADEKKRR